MQDGHDQELNVAVVEAGDGVPEVNGYAVGQACRNLQHPLLASGAGEPRVQGGDHGGPVDDGDWLPAANSGVDGDEPAGEVVPVQPGLGYEKLGGGFEAAQPWAWARSPAASVAGKVIVSPGRGRRCGRRCRGRKACPG